MRMNEVRERCRMTRKAIEYYEEKGLIAPSVSANGYRDYREEDVMTLKEIAVLRYCGMGVDEIRDALSGCDRAIALERCRHIAGLRMRRLADTQAFVDRLRAKYDVEDAFERVQAQARESCTLQERLVTAFPGSYGLYLSMHFGRFLEGRADTPRKAAAYDDMLRYLDDAANALPADVIAYLDQNAHLFGDTAQRETWTHDAIAKGIEDIEDFIERNRDELDAYIAYRASDAFAASPAASMMRTMADFQRRSGYREHIVENMRVLSEAYAAYMDAVEAANEKLLQVYPDARRLQDEA